MKFKVIILLCLCFIIQSCLSHHVSSIENQIQKDEGHENFGSFFSFFKKDSSFQFVRTLKPYIIRSEYVLVDFMGTVKDTIFTSDKKVDWSPIKFDNNFLLEQRQDTVIAEFQYPDSYPPVCYDYYFIKIDKKWFYKTIDVRGITNINADTL